MTEIGSSRLASIAWLPVIVWVVGCDRCGAAEPSTPAPVEEEEPAPEAEAEEAQPAETEPVRVKLEPPTEDELRRIRAAVREGRQHVRRRDLAAGIAAFERALELAPNEGRLLCEIGFIRHQAGDVEQATRDIDLGLRALHRRGIRDERDRDTMGACLYNAGRLHEEAGRLDQAREMYRHSLEYRDNRVVRRRMDALEAGEPTELDRLLGRAIPSTDCRAYERLDDVVAGIAGEGCVDCEEPEIAFDGRADRHRIVVLTYLGPGNLEADIWVAVQKDGTWHLGDAPIGSYFAAMSAFLDGGAYDYALSEATGGSQPLLELAFTIYDSATNAPNLFEVEDEEEYDAMLETSSIEIREIAFLTLDDPCAFVADTVAVSKRWEGEAEGERNEGRCSVEHHVDGGELVIDSPTGDPACLVDLAEVGRTPL